MRARPKSTSRLFIARITGKKTLARGGLDCIALNGLAKFQHPNELAADWIVCVAARESLS